MYRKFILGHFAILILLGCVDNNDGDCFDELSDPFLSLLPLLFVSVFDLSNSVLASSSIERCRRRQQYRKQTTRAAIIIHIITNSKLKRIGKRILRDFRDDFVVVDGENDRFLVLIAEVLDLDITVDAVVVFIIVTSFDGVITAVLLVVFGDVISIISIQSVFVAINVGVIDIESSVCSLFVDIAI